MLGIIDMNNRLCSIHDTRGNLHSTATSSITHSKSKSTPHSLAATSKLRRLDCFIASKQKKSSSDISAPERHHVTPFHSVVSRSSAVFAMRSRLTTTVLCEP